LFRKLKVDGRLMVLGRLRAAVRLKTFSKHFQRIYNPIQRATYLLPNRSRQFLPFQTRFPGLSAFVEPDLLRGGPK
jgi:hypothetical protein